MPHSDTSVAIKQAFNQALNATQGHKCSYQTSFQSIYIKYRGMISVRMFQRGHGLAIKQAPNRALNVTQGHKRSYQISY